MEARRRRVVSTLLEILQGEEGGYGACVRPFAVSTLLEILPSNDAAGEGAW